MTTKVSHEVTQDSIAASRYYQQSQRALVREVTGICIRDEEPIEVTPRLVIVACHKPGCGFVAARENAELAHRSVNTHYSLKHGLSLVQGGRS